MSEAMIVDDILWAVRSPALARLYQLMERVPPGDLTTLEVLAVVAVVESSDQRVNAPAAPVLQLIQARGFNLNLSSSGHVGEV